MRILRAVVNVHLHVQPLDVNLFRKISVGMINRVYADCVEGDVYGLAPRERRINPQLRFIPSGRRR